MLLLFIAATVQADEQRLPNSKRTSLGLYVTAKQAHQKWQADPAGVKIIDVRTAQEFRVIGFPKMAYRVPLNASAREFVGRVKRIARPDETVLIICRSSFSLNRAVS